MHVDVHACLGDDDCRYIVVSVENGMSKRCVREVVGTGRLLPHGIDDRSLQTMITSEQLFERKKEKKINV